HVLVPLPDPGTEQAVVAAAARRDVALDGLGRHWADPGLRRPTAGLVVGFAAPTRTDLTRGLQVLTGVLREAIGR
ncbi:MAG: PLP-dependent aminotransferase family protein, partial [Actinomycetota bacterium]|nr:PLP-dependent aminotransferase family protein [Actinomycetota bacterium]